jgi:aspartyl aminopeptidase
MVKFSGHPSQTGGKRKGIKTIDEGGPLLSMNSIKLGLLNAY